MAKRDLSKAKTVTIRNLSNKLSENDVTVNLKASELIEHEDNEYLFGSVSEEEVKDLAESIRRHAFFTTVNVWRMKDKTYKVFDGHRRRRAVLYNVKYYGGEDSIPCRIFEYPESETERRRMLLAGNIYNRFAEKGSPLYVGRQIAYMRETLKMEGLKGNMKQLQEEFGWSAITIKRYEALLTYSDRMIDAINRELLPVAQAYLMKRLSEEQQGLILDTLEITQEQYEDEEMNRDKLELMISLVKRRGELDTPEKLLNAVMELEMETAGDEKEIAESTVTDTEDEDCSAQDDLWTNNSSKEMKQEVYDADKTVENTFVRDDADSDDQQEEDIEEDETQDETASRQDDWENGDFGKRVESERENMDTLIPEQDDFVSEEFLSKFLKASNRMEEMVSEIIPNASSCNAMETKKVLAKLDYLTQLIEKAKEQFQKNMNY